MDEGEKPLLVQGAQDADGIPGAVGVQGPAGDPGAPGVTGPGVATGEVSTVYAKPTPTGVTITSPSGPQTVSWRALGC
jgi:hypothetical protein